MDFQRPSLEQFGFSGFVSIADLRANACSGVPKQPGVYLIFRDCAGAPVLLDASTGGNFKKKNPTVTKDLLKNNWVDNESVLYIGHTGAATSNETLYSRLRTLLNFGMGKPEGHWGGRYIWQLAGSNELLVAWKPVESIDVYALKSELITLFETIYSKLPFANLRH